MRVWNGNYFLPCHTYHSRPVVLNYCVLNYCSHPWLSMTRPRKAPDCPGAPDSLASGLATWRA